MTIFTKEFSSYNYIFYKFIIFMLVTIFLTSCTFNQKLTIKEIKSKTNALWISHQQQLNKLKSFQMNGVFSYVDQNNKISANFFWQQYNTDNYRLLLMNYLGKIELKLYITSSIIILVDREGKKYIDNCPTQFFYQLTGIKIPVKYLSYWLIGSPTSNTSFTLYESGLLKSIKYKQNNENLELNYLTYCQNNQLKLPSNIKVTKNKIYIRLKINNWMINK